MDLKSKEDRAILLSRICMGAGEWQQHVLLRWPGAAAANHPMHRPTKYLEKQTANHTKHNKLCAQATGHTQPIACKHRQPTIDMEEPT